MHFQSSHCSFFKSMVAAFLVLAISNQTFSDDTFIVDSLRTSWKRISQKEPSWERRIVRFTGFLEGRFNVELPDVWERKKGKGFEDYKQLVFDRAFQDGCRVKLVLDDDFYAILSCSDARESVQWKSELNTPIPFSVLGPHVLYADVGLTSDWVFLIGQVGEIKFVRIASRSDGRAVAHFTFCESSDELTFLPTAP